MELIKGKMKSEKIFNKVKNLTKEEQKNIPYEELKAMINEMSADEIIELKKQMASMKAEIEEKDDRYKRIMAEFENYKKRSAKERESLYDSIISEIVSSFLPVLDNLEKAAKAETKDEEYKKGVELMLQQFKDVLASKGVKEIETVGKTFDPELHEAVSSVVDENLGEKEIKEEFRKGYMIGNRVIRHSMVIVAN